MQVGSTLNLATYFSKAQVGSMRNSRKLLGYFDCGKVVTEANNITVSVSTESLDAFFFESKLFDKQYSISLLNFPERSHVQSYFISITTAIICLVALVFLLVITKLEGAIF